jgi:hypothetical protein
MMARRKVKAMSPVIEVKIARVRVHLDPDINVYQVVVSGNDGEWCHSTSPEILQEFLRGVRAGVAIMGGVLNEQEVPFTATFQAVPTKI